jgi:hypothetical protein
MAEILGVSVITFRRNYLDLIDMENRKRSVKNKLYISGSGQKLHRRFDPDRVKEFLLGK